MKQINELDIHITKAILTDIHINLGEKGVSVSVKGSLLTPDNRQISSFDFETDPWDNKRKFELPVYCNAPIRELFEELTPVIYAKIEGQFPALKDKNAP